VQVVVFHCALMSRTRGTRMQCAGCGVPLCSIGNERVGDDCFTLAHETEDRREMVCRKIETKTTRYVSCTEFNKDSFSCVFYYQ
jgi:hypothetical protein